MKADKDLEFPDLGDFVMPDLDSFDVPDIDGIPGLGDLPIPAIDLGDMDFDALGDMV